MEYIAKLAITDDEGKSNALSINAYSPEERKLLEQLAELFQEWHQAFKNAEDGNGKIINDYTSDYLSFDGFYPGYLKQRVKILFVGREGRSLSGCNYISTLYSAIKNKRIGDQSLDRSLFHSRIIYLTYCIQNREPDYDNLHWASEFSAGFGTEELSCAFMNISKLSNEGESYQANYELIDRSVEISTKGKNFIQEEISLLKPDLILTMNQSRYLSTFGKTTEMPVDPLIAAHAKPYRLEVMGHTCLLIDTHHFSKVGSTKEELISPVVAILQSQQLF